MKKNITIIKAAAEAEATTAILNKSKEKILSINLIKKNNYTIKEKL
jgi:hypothetical protein